MKRAAIARLLNLAFGPFFFQSNSSSAGARKGRVRVTRLILVFFLLLACGSLQAQSRDDIEQYVRQIKASGYSPQVFASLGRWVIHCWVLKLQAQGKASMELGSLYLQAKKAMETRDQARWNDSASRLLQELVKCEEGNATNLYKGEITREEVEEFFAQVKAKPTNAAGLEPRRLRAEQIYVQVIKNGYYTEPTLTRIKEQFDRQYADGNRKGASALLDRMVEQMEKAYFGSKEIVVAKGTDLLSIFATGESTPTNARNVIERLNQTVAAIQFLNSKGLNTSSFPPSAARQLLFGILPSLPEDLKSTKPAGISKHAQRLVSQQDRETLSKLLPDLTHQLYLQAHERLGRNKYCSLSAAVVSFPGDAFAELGEWFHHPRTAFTEAWFRFPAGLAPDVAFAVDVETREGGKQYAFNSVPQAAWMALVYFYPNGKGSVFWGDSANIRGENVQPGRESLQGIYHYFFDTGVQLKPDTWYKLRVEADFGKLRFSSFTLEGPGLKQNIDISKYNISLPMLTPIPFPDQWIQFYVGADKVGYEPGRTTVYVDDVRGGIQTPEGDKAIFEDGFERQSDIILGEQYTDPALLTRDPQLQYRRWKENKTRWGQWVIERPDAKLLFGKAPSCPVRHGAQALVLDTAPLITRDPLIGREK